jgi:hypothetical protein
LALWFAADVIKLLLANPMKIPSKLKCSAISLAILLTGLLQGAHGQGTLVLSNKWSLAAGTRPYLDVANNWPRGLMINRSTGNILVPMGSASPSVNILSGADGSHLGSLNMTGVSGGHAGTFPIDLGGVADDGVIYASSLAVNTAVFQIFRWSSEDTNVVPTLAFGPAQPGPNLVRCGDAFAVRGAGANTQIIASGSGAGFFSIFTTVNGTTFTVTQIALPDGVAAGEAGRGLAFDGTKNAFFAMGPNSTTVHYLSFDLATGTSALIQDLPLAAASLGLSKGSLGGFELLPTLRDGGLATHWLSVYDITDPAAPVVIPGGDFAFPGTPIVDGNVTGSTDFGAGMIAGLSTHNGVLVLSAAYVTNPPVILAGPQDLAAFASSKAKFSVNVSGSAPLHYQWYFNGTTPLAGATDSQYEISSVQAAKAGDYTVVITNIVGSVTSAKAKLTLATPTTYSAKVIADSPLAYWRLGDASTVLARDSWGGHDGAYKQTTVGQPGFSLTDSDTAAAFSPNAVSGVVVEDSSAFTVSGSAPSFTLETWARFNSVEGVQRFFSSWSPGAGIGFGINGAKGLRFTTFGVQDFDLDLETSGFGSLLPGKWYHFVGVAEGGVFNFYINGQAVGAIGFTGEAVPSTVPFWLARNPGGNEVIDGLLDEAAVYGTALSADQVRLHFEARYGANTKPQIRQQPASLTTYVSVAASFKVQAEGSEPITYQWKKAGVDLPGEVADILTLPVLSLTDTGDYTVLLTGPAGSTLSATAHLTVLDAPTVVDLTSDLVLHLKFEGDNQDTSGRSNHGSSVGTPTFVDGKIGSKSLHVSTDVDAGAYNYVTLGVKPDLQFSSNVNFSVAFWVRMTIPGDLPADLPFLCNATNSSYNYGYTFSPSWKDGGWTWSLYNPAKAGVGVDGTAGSINDGNWHHLIYTFDRAGAGTTYLDGNQVDSRSVARVGDIDTGWAANIGQDANGNYGQTGQFDLDDMGIWRRALTSTEAAGLYVAGAINGVTFGTGRPTLTIARTGTQVQLTWSGGSLQSADAVNGEFKDVSSATSPYTVPSALPKQFYRVRR